MSWPPRYTPPWDSHCCSAACCPALQRVQVPAAYVPPADVQIASTPAEQPARERQAIPLASGRLPRHPRTLAHAGDPASLYDCAYDREQLRHLPQAPPQTRRAVWTTQGREEYQHAVTAPGC